MNQQKSVWEKQTNEMTEWELGFYFYTDWLAGCDWQDHLEKCYGLEVRNG